MPGALRILVIDDDRDNADSLAELFQLEGHFVTVAYSGEQAIQAYMNGEFDIAFMDVMMPGRNGVESFIEIRKRKPGARVFMMTGYGVEQLLQQAMHHGAMGILTKPLDAPELMRLVNDVAPNGIVIVGSEGEQLGGRIKSMVDGAGKRCKLLQDAADASAEGADVSVIDLQMPLINSVEFHARLHQDGHICPSIIVAKTGVGTNAVDALSDIAVTGVLSKPFDPLKLLDRLEKLAN